MIISPETIAQDTEAFPIFSDADLATVQEFGMDEEFADGEALIRSGTRDYDCFFILNGEVRVVDISSEGEREVVVHSRGQFIGDIDLLTGRPGVVDIIAKGSVHTARIPNSRIREFLVRFPDIGDRMMGAFTRRRTLLSATDFEGIRIYGYKDCGMTLKIQEFFYRNGVPHSWLDCEKSEVSEKLASLGVECADTPYLTWGKHEIFRKPTLSQLAEHIGISRSVSDEVYDTVIIGAGPSGLGAAVYASSEGLKTLIIDNIGPGGQAGSSSKIENYAGFPAGLSGRDLAHRSYLQALKFGTDFAAPCSALSIEHDPEGLYHLELCTGSTVRTRTIIVSTGISYRKLRVDGMDRLSGSGVYYNATQVESILCQDRPVHVIGAGNSAGQAAMFLSRFASEVNLLVRGDNLQKSMSEYLWSRVEVNPKIKIRFQTELRAIHGEQSIESVTLEDRVAGSENHESSAGVFIFIGGEPCTDFLPEKMARDEKGFVLAGASIADHPDWTEDRLPCALETSWPGIFVSGDCRAGTTKRVAFAIGDGALAVTCVHEFLGTYS